jgi:SAM-dependent methyltransferase
MIPTIELLHQGATPGAWGNLGLWRAETDYAGACRALAQRVGEAAALQAGDKLLSVACGAGEELRLWREQFGVPDPLGLEPDPALVRAAGAHGRVLRQEALAPLSDRFDVVVCVDAAYHFTPRGAWLQAMAQRLKPGGRIAFTDLVLDGRPSAVLTRAAAWCGVVASDLKPAAHRRLELAAAGFADPSSEVLTNEVLGGFARFVARQSLQIGRAALSPAWRRPAATALMIPPCRALGLGYVLLSATRR